MISTTNIITDVREIPSTWTFEYYLKLGEKLVGQEIFMVGPFNPTETIPSFSLFSSREGIYSFKCFSSGKGGSHIEFIKEVFNLKTKHEAILKLMADYQAYLDGGGVFEQGEFQVFEKFRVSSYELRKWNMDDAKFWNHRFHIQSKTLDWLNVSAFSSFEMSKQENGETKKVTKSGPNIYGYFNKQGELYRIYQPYNKECKFIKVMSWVMGEDQLQYKAENLLINKSLKDIGGFTELKIPNWEVIAGECENCIFSKEYIDLKKTQYKNIAVMMDDDKAGKESMQQYQDQFGLPSVQLGMKKDLTDSIEAFGLEAVRERMIERLKWVV
jgi:hypothetical protein